MNSLLIYILKSTLCISLLYLLFRTVLRKESYFALNRIVLLSIVVSSVVIPLLYLPGAIQSPVQVDLLPVFAPVEVQTGAIQATNLEKTASLDQLVAHNQLPDKSDPRMVISWPQLLQYLYLAGFLFTIVMLLRGLFTLVPLFRGTKAVQMDGYRLLVIEKEIAAFSFGRYVILSQKDFEEHRQTLLAHEQAHIRLHHFFDLLLLETVRIFHWFNPAIYWLIKDLKEVHEFQADNYTLTNGIDATQYQLLIIQKGVGSQRFALANSFNHCQIKKRITMMNKSKTSKAWSWKVATFLPLLALLLMAFGKKAENGPPSNSTSSSVEQVLSKDSIRQWNETDFLSLEGLNSLIKKGKTPNWKDPDFSSFEKNGKWVTVKKDYFNGFVHCEVQIDSRSQLWIGNRTKLLDWNEFRDSIRTYVDYEAANNLSRPFFHQAMINGVMKMSPQCYFFIISDKSTPFEDYQRFLNTIGNTVNEVRGKYSLEIYKKDYSKLNPEQKEQIDIMVPLMAWFLKTPQLRQEKQLIQNDSSISDSGIVTGNITLSDGRPLPRVPVRIKGSNTRTFTDKDGLFKMADVPKNCMLEFQNVGLKSVFACADFAKPMNIKMELSSFWIDRVKVICQANDNNPPKPLPKHGFASNMTNSALLFVLDGVIVDKTKMNQVEPDDIKSVSVLNAKSATEKYGQLAKNGVMEIQTKEKVNLSAENGKVVVEVNEYADNQKMELHHNNIIDEMPEFKGGMKGLMIFISGNIKYPDKAQADKIQGNVLVNFVINHDGKVENVNVENAVDASLDAEAIRVISSMPDWNPGKQSGEPVDVSFTIPVQFAIK